MNNKQQKSKDGESKFHRLDKKSLIIGSIIATLIAMTPYLFYLYESAPDVQVWETFLFRYDSKYYGSIFVLAWTLTGKIIPLFLLFIWFFTCRHWWYHVLLVPIAMYAYQIFITLNDDLNYVDSNQLIYLIPIMAIIVPSIYLIRAQIFNKINSADKSLEELEEEFKMTPKNFWDRLRNYF
ncbi:hypothetical protein [Aestuariibaculum sediminum]|uniref:Uncharacterized protein n=1 Tax=Aestuariibaculum sediminum TaxID=2770637 RepID=A0A8J6U7G1_9FLAO|nr:hypothetical protein [Aestuariibaculum sediminum]MBD0831943.1 hypothetical protein [Aestuariibaculum sediminum]